MKLLRVDMHRRKAFAEPLPAHLETLGGRALTARLLAAGVPPHAEPLGRHNRLILATGPMAGCGVPCGERLSAGAKSPLTHGIKESNAGGVLAYRMARAGLRAIVVEDRPASGELWVLRVSGSTAELVDGSHLRRLGVYETARRLQAEFGPDAGLAITGPAGEMLLASAGIFVNDTDGVPGRACGRGGLGAVMGAKGLKAIVVTGEGSRLPVRRRDHLKQAIRQLSALIRQTPQTAKAYPTYGTAGSVKLLDALGGLPTRNFTAGSFERAGEICGETLRELVQSRGGEGKTGHPCMPGCLVRCSNVVPDPAGKAIVAPLEYETIAMLGSNLGIGELDAIARLNYLANDAGVDTIEAGVALGIAMQAGLLGFGDSRAVAGVLEEVAGGTVLGRVIGSGATITGRVLGAGRVPAVKGQGIAAHEPRGVKGMAMTYAMSPMGADHTAAVTFRANVEHHRGDGHLEYNRALQIRVAGLDSLGMCLFVAAAVNNRPEVLSALMSAVYGREFDPDYVTGLGRETLKYERAFNLAAGFGPAADRLPEFMAEEAIPPFDLVADTPEAELAAFWDPAFWGELPPIGSREDG